jgi:tetratricopeptide (TPR) repeat protein
MAEEQKDEAAQDDIEEVEETVEEADDNSSSDTVGEAEDDSSSDTAEEVEDNSSLDTAEEAEDSAPSDDEETQDIDEEAQDIIEEVEEDSSALLASFEADLEFLHDSNNMSFYQAHKAYYEDRNYEGAIAEFQAAIEYEKSHPSDPPDVEESEDSEELADPKPPNDVLVKSMYWMAEAYLKLDQTDQAVETFGQLLAHYSLHYLAPAAQRRIASLKLDEESGSA